MAGPFCIVCGAEVIGHSALERGDPYQGIRAGRFTPTPPYAALEPLFQELSLLTIEGDADASEALRARREQLAQQATDLGLRVTTATGQPLPTAWVWIEDYAAELDDIDARSVTICVDDGATYERLFG